MYLFQSIENILEKEQLHAASNNFALFPCTPFLWIDLNVKNFEKL